MCCCSWSSEAREREESCKSSRLQRCGTGSWQHLPGESEAEQGATRRIDDPAGGIAAVCVCVVVCEYCQSMRYDCCGPLVRVWLPLTRPVVCLRDLLCNYYSSLKLFHLQFIKRTAPSSHGTHPLVGHRLHRHLKALAMDRDCFHPVCASTIL